MRDVYKRQALYLQYQKEEKSITGITHRSIRSLKSQPPSE